MQEGKERVQGVKGIGSSKYRVVGSGVKWSSRGEPMCSPSGMQNENFRMQNENFRLQIEVNFRFQIAD
jgi:hypothetical protein